MIENLVTHIVIRRIFRRFRSMNLTESKHTSRWFRIPGTDVSMLPFPTSLGKGFSEIFNGKIIKGDGFIMKDDGTKYNY